MQLAPSFYIINAEYTRGVEMALDRCQLSGGLVKQLLNESLKGKSFSRILLNYSLRNLELTGKILDLGSGSDSASYNRFLTFRKPYEITYTDFYKEGPNLLKLNLENRFNIRDKTYDFVLCFNVLEHIYNYQNVISESHRILKKSGVLICSAPFLVRFHPDPNDYFRYSHQAIKKLFENAGFELEKMVYLGFGPFSACYENISGLIPNFLKPLPLFLLLACDTILEGAKKDNLNYPIIYLYVFRK